MALLTPLFLAGLAALAIPLLVHLIRRERIDAVEFPSLMFISRIPQPTVKRRRIRNWPLFVLRSLALILLVGAFARPFVEQPAGELGTGDGAREVVILLDRSYSMGYADRWQQAVAAARETVDQLGVNDRATVVLFDAAAHTAVAATTDRARLRQALDTARTSAGTTRYMPALKLAQGILARSDLSRLEAVLISDFQRSGWEGAAGTELPAGALLRTVHVGRGDVANLVVTGVTLDRAQVAGRDRVTPTAHLANRGSESLRDVNVVLEADGRVVQTARADVPAGGTTAVELQPLTAGDSAVRASVRAGDDALPIDNVFHFVLAPQQGVRVLVVAARSDDASLYVRRALDLAQEPPFRVTIKTDGMPTAAELERTDVVLLNDVVPPDGDAARRLLEWIRAGGGVVLAMGERTSTTPWGSAVRELTGGPPEPVIDRIQTGGARLGYLDYSHPVFEAFRGPRTGGFSGARFFRYRPAAAGEGLRAADDTTGVTSTVLARFDDGSVALLERAVGSGRVLVWGSSLDVQWNDMPLEPIFLPFVHQLVKHAAGFAPPAAWQLVGQIVDVTTTSGEPLMVTAPSGARTEVPAGNTLLSLDEPGFHEVRERRAGSAALRTFAVNVDVAESELSVLDPSEIASAATVPATSRRGTSRSLPREEQERRQSLWWYLMVTVFVLLTAEVAMANRRSSRVA
jgi:hypothetical protein